jgi:hypothetical protein
MLDRSIPTREALVHSIPISEVKDMKSDVLRALKASLSEKIWTLFGGSILTIFKKEKLHRLWISFYNIPPLGLTFLKSIWNLLAIPFFLLSHTHSYLLIYLKYKNQVLLIFHFLTLKVLWWFQAQNCLITPFLKSSYSFYFFELFSWIQP